MRRSTILGLTLVCVFAAACSTAPKSDSARQELISDSDRAVNKFRASDSGIASHIKKAHGYAVFPTVGKGGAVVGGAYGRGIVYEQGKQIGFCDLSQGSIGLQLGGQKYAELILFETKESLDLFKRGEVAFAAQASAVAAASGAGANAKYKDGVMVFTQGEEGLMAEASLGGQKFDYRPMD